MGTARRGLRRADLVHKVGLVGGGSTLSVLRWRFGAFAFVALTETFQSMTRHWQLALGTAIIVLVLFLPGGLASIGGRFRRTPVAGRRR